MCRMFGYVGGSARELESLHRSLRQSCKTDECLQAAYPERAGQSHEHGWGYVICASNGLFHYRTSGAIFRDAHPLPEVEGEIFAIFHGRLTTGSIVGDAIFSHPFVAVTNEAVFFMGHNGSLTNDVGKAVADKVDSEWAIEQIAAHGGIARALPLMKEKTGSSLNLLLMTIERKRRKAGIHYLNYFKKDGGKKDAYYNMYVGKTRSGGRAVFSSTLKLHGIAEIDGEEIEPALYDEIGEL
jgi:predicted glutamine amidotransferase